MRGTVSLLYCKKGYTDKQYTGLTTLNQMLAFNPETNVTHLQCDEHAAICRIT